MESSTDTDLAVYSDIKDYADYREIFTEKQAADSVVSPGIVFIGNCSEKDENKTDQASGYGSLDDRKKQVYSTLQLTILESLKAWFTGRLWTFLVVFSVATFVLCISAVVISFLILSDSREQNIKQEKLLEATTNKSEELSLNQQMLFELTESKSEELYIEQGKLLELTKTKLEELSIKQEKLFALTTNKSEEFSIKQENLFELTKNKTEKINGLLKTIYDVLLPPGYDIQWEKISNSIYLFGKDTVTWHKAEEICNKVGAHLIKIGSSNKNELIKAMMREEGRKYSTWIGLNDLEKEHSWKWVSDNSSTPFSDWYPDEPEISNRRENCAILNHIHEYDWFDTGCDRKDIRYICEKKI